MSNFHPLEVVGRGSETQLQAGEIFFFECSALRVNRERSQLSRLKLRLLRKVCEVNSVLLLIDGGLQARRVPVMAFAVNY